MKKCSKCKVPKELICFGSDKVRKDGLNTQCFECRRLTRKNGYKKQKTLNPNLNKEYYQKNKEKESIRKAIFYKKNKEKILKRCKEWFKNNPDSKIKTNIKYRLKYNEIKKQYRINNPEKMNFLLAKRRANKLEATPSWADLKLIELIYQKAKWLSSVTGLEYEVDHVIPLQGKNVCGLHIWENLQILEKGLNKKKGNKF